MELSELVDLDELRGLCESFTEVTGAVTAVLDLQGNVLIATGWQDICTQFHRANAATCARCRESDTILAGQLKQGDAYNVYRCKNGLVDVAVPITIGREHVANFFTGQFFSEPPDRNYFVRQAHEFGFDEAAYLSAMERAPVFADAQVKAMMSFFTRLAKAMGEMGLARLRLQQANSQLHGRQLMMERTESLARMASFEWDVDTNVVTWSPEMFLIFGRDPALGVPNLEGQVELYTSESVQRLFDAVRKAVVDGIPYELELMTVQPDGAQRPCFIKGFPERDESGRVVRLAGLVQDITERKRTEDVIKQLAYHDALTQLPNRRLLSDRLQQAMATSSRSKNFGALMFLDLDNFKPLNDAYGHEAGDALLIEVTDRLKTCVREMDTVARFGGDEFVVMISELASDNEASTEQVEAIAEKIRTVLSMPYRLAVKDAKNLKTDIVHRCTASIGVTLFIGNDATQDDLLKRADDAMYQAKEAGRNMIRFYSFSASG